MLGGLTFFFFGLKYARTGLQLLTGDRLRLAIARLTENRFKALSIGALITVILQSSTATLLMLVSLAGSGLLNLSQAFGVILGADIGTTFVVILLSIKKVADYALLLVVIGFALEWIFKESKRTKYTGRILFGFGLVFHGMKMMTQTAGPLAMDPTANAFFQLLSHNPAALLVVAVLLTLVVQTSAALIGMTMAMALSGVMTLETAIPVILGANVGTCFSAILASTSGNINGRRVAVAHLSVKITGVLLAMPFISQIAFFVQNISSGIHSWIPMIDPGMAGSIAIVHLLFNLSLALLFLPFLPFGVWAVSKMVPERKRKEVFGPKYLDKQALDTPPLAFAHAKREISRIGNMTYDLYRDCLKLLSRDADTEAILEEIEERDDRIDMLDREVRFYLAKIFQEALTEKQTAQQMALLSVTADLEGIGDIISKDLSHLARKKVAKSRIFSQQGWQDLQKLHKVGLENFGLVISAFTSPSEELTKKVLHQGDHFNELEQQLRQSHILRLHAGQVEAFETSSIHLDILGNLRRINAHLVHVAQVSLQT